MSTSGADLFKLHFIIFLWGFTAVLGLLISVHPIDLVFYRTLLAVLGVGALLLQSRTSFIIKGRDMICIILIGFIVSAHWITFFGAARLSNASVCLVGVATGSLWTSLLEPILNKRKVARYEVFLGLLVIVGIYIIYQFDFKYPLGLAVSVFSGFLSALFFVLNSRFAKRLDTRVITFYEMTGAFIGTTFFLVIYWLFDETRYFLSWPQHTDWIYLGVLSLVCTIYAYNLSLQLMKRLSVFFMQLTLNLEPIYGILLALLVFGDSERMNFAFYAGAIIVLCAVMGYPLLKKLFQKNPFDNPSENSTPV